MNIQPIRLYGNWDEGYALDNHISCSICIGKDINDRPMFNNTRTILGEYLFQFKYRNNYNCLTKIMNIISPFLDSWKIINNIDFIIPVPPSDKNRRYQPTEELAKEIATYLKIPYIADLLYKSSLSQSKNMDRRSKSLYGTIKRVKNATRPHNILIIDDLYSTGKTLNECTRILKEDKNIKNICIDYDKN